MGNWFQWNGVFLCAPPKCGGTALYCAALGIDPGLGRHVFSTAQNLTEFYEEPGQPAFMAVRDPVERFSSLWRDKCRDGDENMPMLYGMTPESLMDLIESDPDGNPKETGPRDRCVMISFDHDAALLARAKGFRIGFVLPDLGPVSRANCDVHKPEYVLVDQKHVNGPVWPGFLWVSYEVADKAMATRLMGHGVHLLETMRVRQLLQ